MYFNFLFSETHKISYDKTKNNAIVKDHFSGPSFYFKVNNNKKITCKMLEISKQSVWSAYFVHLWSKLLEIDKEKKKTIE